ncbi:MAG: hypothetical protein ACK2T0_09675 [Anaerolineales bacterium]
MWSRLERLVQFVLFGAVFISLLTYSAPQATTEDDRIRAFTRKIEFDYVSWLLNAARIKVEQGSVGVPGYFSREESRVVVSDYMQVTQQVIQAEDALNRIYSDPAVPDKAAAAGHVKAQLELLRENQGRLAPLAEGVLQGQIAQVAADDGLTALGQPIPAVLFHMTSVPDALIVSPRSHIEEIDNVSIEPGLPADEQTALEDRVMKSLDVSALVVPIGGVGVYPTMVMQTTDLNWLASTIAHEWTHNFLTLRPLGLLYDKTPQLRTMNETTADIVGTEVGKEVLSRFYGQPQASGILPDLGAFSVGIPSGTPPAPPPFDFRAEMHTTRVRVDALLAEGKITEAEKYMEQRRQVFVANGYYLRRLNQAYFAFYGAYADIPGGAAGADPVGPAVRALRAKSGSLAEFLNRISWMTSFAQLQQAVGH